MNITFGSHFTLPKRRITVFELQSRFPTGKEDSPFVIHPGRKGFADAFTSILDENDPEVARFLKQRNIKMIAEPSALYYTTKFFKENPQGELRTWHALQKARALIDRVRQANEKKPQSPMPTLFRAPKVSADSVPLARDLAAKRENRKPTLDERVLVYKYKPKQKPQR